MVTYDSENSKELGNGKKIMNSLVISLTPPVQFTTEARSLFLTFWASLLPILALLAPVPPTQRTADSCLLILAPTPSRVAGVCPTPTIRLTFIEVSAPALCCGIPDPLPLHVFHLLPLGHTLTLSAASVPVLRPWPLSGMLSSLLVISTSYWGRKKCGNTENSVLVKDPCLGKKLTSFFHINSKLTHAWSCE